MRCGGTAICSFPISLASMSLSAVRNTCCLLRYLRIVDLYMTAAPNAFYLPACNCLSLKIWFPNNADDSVTVIAEMRIKDILGNSHVVISIAVF